MGQSLQLRASATIVRSQTSSKCCDTWKQKASSRFTCVWSYNFHVFTKLITIFVELTGASLSESSNSILGSISPCTVRISPWVRYLRCWRSLPRPLFMGVVCMAGLSRWAKALAVWMCDLVTFVAISNESDSLLANLSKCIMRSNFFSSHSWVRGSENMFEIDIALKFTFLHRFDCPTKHEYFSSSKKNQQIFFVIDF